MPRILSRIERKQSDVNQSVATGAVDQPDAKKFSESVRLPCTQDMDSPNLRAGVTGKASDCDVSSDQSVFSSARPSQPVVGFTVSDTRNLSQSFGHQSSRSQQVEIRSRASTPVHGESSVSQPSKQDDRSGVPANSLFLPMRRKHP